MEKSRRFSIIIALVVIALEIGAYIYAALFFRERFHVFLITLFLCGLGGLLGGIVTRPKARAVSAGIMILGLIALGAGLYLLHAFRFHERAYTIIGIGFLCFLGGLAGITIRSISATLFGMVVLGLIALSTGLYFLIGLNYHGRAYTMLGIGAVGILGSLISYIIIRYKSHVIPGSS
ncbi:MAG TPA: hypothetical protein VF844_21415 [Ktedonobacteraceae bacterium]